MCAAARNEWREHNDGRVVHAAGRLVARDARGAVDGATSHTLMCVSHVLLDVIAPACCVVSRQLDLFAKDTKTHISGRIKPCAARSLR